MAGDFAHPDFVADHLDWLAALRLTPGENISEKNKCEPRRIKTDVFADGAGFIHR